LINLFLYSRAEKLPELNVAASPDGGELALVGEHDVLLYRVKVRVISGAFP
jgi:hypothetical protein